MIKNNQLSTAPIFHRGNDTVTRFATIELHKDALAFSAGHLMVLSASERETLHGHDYRVAAAFYTALGENGLALDLREYRDKLQALCETLDYHFILPGNCRHLTIQDHPTDTQQWQLRFNQTNFALLKKDVMILPISNVTLEELSFWFLQQLTTHPDDLNNQGIYGMRMTVFNGRNESGSAEWGRFS